MKKPSIISLIFTVIMLLSGRHHLAAQSNNIDSLLAKALFTDELLPILIDSAIKFSPDLKRTVGNESYARANLAVSKRAIFSAVNLQSSYMYGTNYTSVNSQSIANPSSNLTTAQTGFYNVGIGVQLPITYVINRKNIIKSGQSQIDMAIAEKENLELIIKQEVIRLYQEFKLGQKLMVIGSISRQSALVNKTMAEKDFLNGQLTIDKMSIVVDSYNKINLEYETYLNKFQATFMQLEAFTGINLSALIMRVR